MHNQTIVTMKLGNELEPAVFAVKFLQPALRLQKQVTRITVPNYPNRPENVRKINIKVIQTSLKTVLSCSIPLLTCSENSLMYGQFTPFVFDTCVCVCVSIPHP